MEAGPERPRSDCCSLLDMVIGGGVWELTVLKARGEKARTDSKV